MLKESYVDPGITSYLKRRGYKKIGRGTDQHTFTDPNGEILKVFGASEDESFTGFTDSHKMFMGFYNFCQKNSSNKFLPKFHGVESFEYNDQKHLQIKMERLHPLPQQVAIELSEIGYHANLPATDEKRKEYKQNLFDGKFSEDGLVVLSNMIGKNGLLKLWRTFEELSKLRKTYSFNVGWDMHEGNFMARSDGTPVIVDPFAV